MRVTDKSARGFGADWRANSVNYWQPTGSTLNADSQDQRQYSLHCGHPRAEIESEPGTLPYLATDLYLPSVVLANPSYQ